MNKCSNNLVPEYISDIIPPRVADVSNYPLRSRDNFSNIYNRTETARRSCIPSSVTHWNSIRANIREADTYLSFRTQSLIQCECPFILFERSKKAVSATRKNPQQL